MQKRRGERTVVLNMRKVALNHGHDKEYLGVVPNGNGRVTCTDPGDKVLQAHALDSELRIDRGRSGDILQSLAMNRCVRWRHATKVVAVSGKRPRQRLLRKQSR